MERKTALEYVSLKHFVLNENALEKNVADAIFPHLRMGNELNRA
jgi:hypothetical protein